MSTDKYYLDSMNGSIPFFQTYLRSKLKRNIAPAYPLDSEVITTLQGLIVTGKDNELFEKQSQVQDIWITLIKKSIVCLRYYDTREPFLKNKTKKPLAYGTDSLLKYFEKYTDFESLLYGGSNHYRDHVVHVFRVWLLGVEVLLRGNCQLLD